MLCHKEDQLARGHNTSNGTSRADMPFDLLDGQLVADHASYLPGPEFAVGRRQ